MDAEESSGDDRTNLIINYLPQSLTDQEMYKLFVVNGPLKSCRIMKDMKTGYSYGFGFVDYEKPEDARKAIAQMNNLTLQHKTIKVSFARPAGEDIKNTNLYVQNLPRTYNEEHLVELFAPYGNIVQRNLLKDKLTGMPKGVGFVRFDKKSEADAAIANVNGTIPEGGAERLVVRLAEEHGKNKATYYAGYHAALNTGGRARGQFRPMMGGGQGPGPGSYGRGNFSNSQGYGRGNFNNSLGYGRGNFNNSGGKMLAGRLGKRYNPMGGGTFSDFSDNYYGFN